MLQSSRAATSAVAQELRAANELVASMASLDDGDVSLQTATNSVIAVTLRRSRPKKHGSTLTFNGLFDSLIAPSPDTGGSPVSNNKSSPHSEKAVTQYHASFPPDYPTDGVTWRIVHREQEPNINLTYLREISDAMASTTKNSRGAGANFIPSLVKFIKMFFALELDSRCCDDRIEGGLGSAGSESGSVQTTPGSTPPIQITPGATEAFLLSRTPKQNSSLLSSSANRGGLGSGAPSRPGAIFLPDGRLLQWGMPTQASQLQAGIVAPPLRSASETPGTIAGLSGNTPPRPGLRVASSGSISTPTDAFPRTLVGNASSSAGGVLTSRSGSDNALLHSNSDSGLASTAVEQPGMMAIVCECGTTGSSGAMARDLQAYPSGNGVVRDMATAAGVAAPRSALLPTLIKGSWFPEHVVDQTVLVSSTKSAASPGAAAADAMIHNAEVAARSGDIAVAAALRSLASSARVAKGFSNGKASVYHTLISAAAATSLALLRQQKVFWAGVSCCNAVLPIILLVKSSLSELMTYAPHSVIPAIRHVQQVFTVLGDPIRAHEAGMVADVLQNAWFGNKNTETGSAAKSDRNDPQTCARPTLLECAICEQPIRPASSGRTVMQCLKCGHGGYVSLMEEWLKHSTECPTGCGCTCVFTMS